MERKKIVRLQKDDMEQEDSKTKELNNEIKLFKKNTKN